MKAALAAADKAIAKAETASEKRFDSVNEFRSTLSDQARTFIPRREFETAFGAIQKKIEELQKFIWIAFGAALAIQFVIGIAIAVWKR